MFTHKNNKTQRHPHFTDSPPRFINEMGKLSKNMIHRSLYRTKQTNVHKTVFTHQTNALKYVCHKKKKKKNNPADAIPRSIKNTFRKEISINVKPQAPVGLMCRLQQPEMKAEEKRLL